MSAISDALQLLLLPFAASVLFVLIHSPLGIHIVRRNLVFADLALAQLSALGATVAFAIGYAPSSTAGFAYALLFTVVGAALLTMIELLQKDKKLSRLDTYGLASLVTDCRLGLPAAGEKAIHCLVPKSTWVGSSTAKR